jgi:hypothetical protein
MFAPMSRSFRTVVGAAVVLVTVVVVAGACSSNSVGPTRDSRDASNDVANSLSDGETDGGLDSSNGVVPLDGPAEPAADGGAACQVTGTVPTNVYGVACYPITASVMPVGSCSGTSVCNICEFSPCQANLAPPRIDYSCSCDHGTWNCTIAWQDTSSCPPGTSGDASVDGPNESVLDSAVSDGE